MSQTISNNGICWRHWGYLIVILFISGCGGAMPTSMYVDMARALTPALFVLDDESAVSIKELRNLAEAGHPEAQYRLGVFLYEQSSKGEGFGWVCRAAKSGYCNAMVKLGYWSEHHHADFITAVAWYKVAEERGHPWSKKYRIYLEKKMTADQINEAMVIKDSIGDKKCVFKE